MPCAGDYFSWQYAYYHNNVNDYGIIFHGNMLIIIIMLMIIIIIMLELFYNDYALRGAHLTRLFPACAQ